MQRKRGIEQPATKAKCMTTDEPKLSQTSKLSGSISVASNAKIAIACYGKCSLNINGSPIEINDILHVPNIVVS